MNDEKRSSSRSRRRAARQRLWRRAALGAGIALLVLAAAGIGWQYANTPAKRLARHITAAEAYRSSSDPAAAIIEYKNAIRLEPNDAALRFALAEIYFAQDRFNEAAKEFEKAQNLGQHGEALTTRLMQVAAARGDFESALEYLEALPEPLQQSPTALAVRGRALYRSGDRTAAAEAYSAALETDPDETAALLGLARISLTQRDTATAADLVARLLSIEPDNPEARQLMAVIAARQGDFDGAVENLEAVVATEPNRAGAQLELVRALILAQDYERATQLLDGLAERDVNNPLHAYLRGLIALFERRHDDAITAFSRVLLSVPQHLGSQYLLAESLYAVGRIKDAEQAAEGFHGQLPGYLPGIRLLGAIYLRTGQTQNALDILGPAEAEAPEDPYLLALLGRALINDGRADEGNAYLDRAVALDGGLVDFQIHQALGRLAGGDLTAAVAELERIGDETGLLLQTDYLLVAMYMRRGEHDAAQDAVAEILAAHPDSPLSLNLAGTVSAARRDLPGARALFEQALLLDADYVPAMLNLAELEVGDRAYSEARTWYEKVLSLSGENTAALLGLGNLAVLEKDPASAAGYFNRAIENDATAVRPRVIMARHYLATGDRRRALELASEAQNYAPDHPEVLLILGRSQIANNRLDEAATTLAQLLEQQPKSIDALLNLANVAALQSNFADAREFSERVLALSPVHPQALAMLVRLETAEGDFDAARARVDTFSKAFPGRVEGEVLRGDVEYAAGEYGRAAELYRAAQQRSASAPLAAKLYDALMRGGEAEAARAALADYHDRNRGDERVALMLAAHDLEAGDEAAALRQYEAILSRQPRNITALNQLAGIYQNTDIEKATSLAARAFELAPGSIQVLDTYGWILARQNKHERSLELLGQAADLAPDSTRVQYHYAVALAKVGQRQAALDALTRLLDSDTAFEERPAAERLLSMLQ